MTETYIFYIMVIVSQKSWVLPLLPLLPVALHQQKRTLRPHPPLVWMERRLYWTFSVSILVTRPVLQMMTIWFVQVMDGPILASEYRTLSVSISEHFVYFRVLLFAFLCRLYLASRLWFELSCSYSDGVSLRWRASIYVRKIRILT